MSHLESIRTSEDLRNMSVPELETLCGELRKEIVATVSRNGGHLASNLGVVELTVALHRCFRIPEEPLLFDVGHQCYVHKLLTGRKERFRTLRQKGGLSGFPHPAESPADVSVSGHSGSALAAALGMAEARAMAGTPGKVLALIGDASLNNGVTLEALNCIRERGKNLVVILNDNKMSISPNVGGFSGYLNRLISWRGYNRVRHYVRSRLMKSPRRRWLFRLTARIDGTVKALFLPPAGIFHEFGLRYFGPVNGHSLPDLLRVLETVRKADSPVLVHVVTEKGRGIPWAENAPSRYHGIRNCDPETGKLPESAPGFSAAFGEAMVQMGERHPELDAVSAAMIEGTGLSAFQKRFPERCHDTGIAEGCAVTYSAGLAIAGRRPVCAMYSTFFQRAMDNFYHDVLLAKLPVILCLDRGGAVEDGPTHHGIYDLSFLRALPNLQILSPRCPEELLPMLEYAWQEGSPVVIRYPRGGSECRNMPCPAAPVRKGRMEILKEGNGRIVIFALGAEALTALKAAERVAMQTVGKEQPEVVNVRFLKPFDGDFVRRISRNGIVVTVEDHVLTGGLASAVTEALQGIPVRKFLPFGWSPERPPSYGNTHNLKEEAGLDAGSIADKITEAIHEYPEIPV